MTDLLRVYFDY